MYKKNILVTGGAGFIGSNFISYFTEKYPEYFIVNLDKLTYASDLESLELVNERKNYTFIQGDICDSHLLSSIFKKHSINGVIHFAAESHVDNSITGPYEFIKTNIEGTFQLLETAKNFWMESSLKIKKGYESARFHHVSTDEVYGTLGQTGLFSETTRYAPNSPYSASKASSDFLVRAYSNTFGLNTTISNCSNNYGPYQHQEKLIPTIIKNALNLRPIPIYGNGLNIRDWLYVSDHCTGVDAVYHKGNFGETYNVGGSNEKTNIEVVNIVCNILDKAKPRIDKKSYSDLINFVQDRAGHDERYAIDASKIQNELSWQAKENFDTGIRKTVTWYLNKWQTDDQI